MYSKILLNLPIFMHEYKERRSIISNIMLIEMKCITEIIMSW